MSDYIPPELIPNILARLPIDAVLRCTSVCKSWYSLITSPSFISSHLNLSIPYNEARLFVSYGTHSKYDTRLIGKDQYFVHRDNLTFDEIAKLDCPFISGKWGFTIIGAFNGLFCLSDFQRKKIFLWNPSLRKSLLLPDFRLAIAFSEYGPYRECIGFGFLPTTNDYKIVRIVYLFLPDGNNKVPPAVEIYELSTGTWRDVNVGDFPYVVEDRTQQAFLKGIVHWAAYNPNKVGGSFFCLIVSFDMTSEKFGSLMVPNCVQSGGRFSLSTFKESLCLVHTDASDTFCSIWVMKEYGVADSWEKQFNIDTGLHGLLRPLYFRENGDILCRKEYGHSVFGSATLVSYDPKNDRVMTVRVSKIATPFDVDTYVESLVLIKGSNEFLRKCEYGTNRGI